jgi:predicted porin
MMDLAIVSESGGPRGSVVTMQSGVQGGSRLGFRGKEDLGGGLSAHFVIEAGILADTGASLANVTFGRQTLVGLTGSFGTVNFGRQFNLITNAVGSIDPFGGGTEGAYSNIMNFSFRTSNGVYYTTPTVGGFTGDLAYGVGEVAGNSSGNREIGASISYANGPVYAVVAHRSLNDALAANTNQVTVMGVSYNFGPVTAALGYGINKDDASVDSHDLLVGASVPFGAGSAMASYIRHDDRSGRGQHANQVAVGYTYTLSKRTNVYTAYARIDNKNNAGFTVGNATEFGSGPRGLAFGLRHKF